MAMSRLLRALLPLSVLAVGTGCGRPALPDPREAAREYAEKAARGDAEGLYAMLSKKAQRTHGREGVRRLVADAKPELSAQARGLTSDGVSVEAAATVPLANGDHVELTLEQGDFRIASGGTLPSGARTPAQALEDLRRALSRRSYAALLRTLSSEARGSMETDLRSLVNGLSNAETLDVKVDGDRAEVEVPGGHAVTLKREGGVWRVDDVK
jgi:hypothetical protein